MLATNPTEGIMASSDAGLMVFAVIFVAAVVILGAVPGVIADQRRHSKATAIKVCGWLGWFFTLGILWLVAIIWAFTEDNRDAARTQAKGSQAFVRCPWCAEQILAAAIVCKYCGRDVPSSAPAPPAPARQAVPAQPHVYTVWRVSGIAHSGKVVTVEVRANSKDEAIRVAAKSLVEVHRTEPVA